MKRSLILFTLVIAFSAAAISVAACGSTDNVFSANGTSTQGSSSGGGKAAGASSGSLAGGGGSIPGDGGPGDAASVTQLDGGVDSSLPALPALTRVVATEREDSVGIDFDPVDKAVDYRVYPLPNDGDVTVNADGSLAIKNAVYRCAGLRQTLDLPNNVSNDVNNPDAGQAYVNGIYSWGAQIPANPTLGYVYVEPATDLVPVYAIGVHPSATENGWRETRPKVYTTDAVARQTLLGQGGRDDGIAFYVPSAASSATQTIYHSQTAAVQYGTPRTEHYFASADMAAHASDTVPPEPAFQVLSAADVGTQPLMAVLYQAPSEYHVELAAGQERFNRAANQGAGPLWHLEWSGLTAPTVLVVEALASGCPYQGFLTAEALAAPPHQAFSTLDELQKASATGEVYVNGQYDLPGASWTDISLGMTSNGLPLLQTPNASPIPIARSFVQVAPQPHDPAAWDWYQGFSSGSDLGAVTQVSGCTDYNCDRWQSSAFDISAYRLDEPMGVEVITYGELLGQLWVAFDDSGQDVTGKVRFTALQKATIDPDPTKFLHVTMSVDIVSSDRRYPQLIVSDQPAPVQEGLSTPDGNTLLVQPILGPSMRIEAQAIHGLVNGNPWDVNNQAQEHRFIDYDNWNGGSTPSATLPPAEPPLEHAGMDRMTKFDAYISSGRTYLFMDGRPAGCTLYPSGFALAGLVTVSFGDVLYHEGAPDELVCSQTKPYAFMHEHQCLETKRHWDDLGFKSGTEAPAWDDANFPCLPY